MLCDQASDTINSKRLPTASHSPLLFFLCRIDLLSTARGKINPVDHSQWLRGSHPTLHYPPGGPVYRSTQGRVFTRVFDAGPTRS